MQRTLYAVLVAVLSLGLVFGGLAGCGRSGSEGQPSGGQTGESSQPVIELKYADWHTTAMNLGKKNEETIKKLEERSNGRIKVVPYFGETLLKSSDLFRGVATGQADIALYMHGLTPGVHVLNEVFKLPLGFRNLKQAQEGYNKILEMFPELQQENEKAGVRWLAIRPMPAYNVNMVDKLVRVPADLKGKTVKAAAMFARIVAGAGGGVTDVPPGDVYSAAERGVITGQICPPMALTDFKTDEVFKCHTFLEPNFAVYGLMGFIINLETWNKLSPDLQQLLVEVFQEGCDAINDMNVQEIQDVKAKWGGDPNRKVAEITPEEAKVWEEAAQDYVEEWIKNAEAKGWDARKVYEGARQVAAEMNKQ
ncbi:MAG: TRAP transporter substrate-binding protein DctP [Clostridia bacterium]|jgi:TRAP-type C4-dicarboxylate transport system substrate-binding protein|nr:TRAP transporter substrate-binding protein DctP [Clostridia bacterium]MDH7573701.1 TRAP transporter substrate-binding protein DctP [Clostridia bacterium]